MNAIRPAHIAPISLRQAVASLAVTGHVDDHEITGIRLDSREITPGELYVALPGTRAHGASFARQAVDRGAAAVLTDPDGAILVGDLDVPVLVTADVRRDMAKVSAQIFHCPSDKLELFGVTGTNGKTTTVALLESALIALGRHVGTIGTLGFRLDRHDLASARSTITTPESPDLQALLAVMAEQGAQSVAVEVSSHALELARVDAVRFAVAAFLNLGRDHLDFHATMEDYFEAKAKLFEPSRIGAAVVWIDGEYGPEVARRARAVGVPTVTVGRGGEADYQLGPYHAVAPLGGRADLITPTTTVTLELSLPGEHNMVDAAIAVAMLEAAGYTAAEVIAGLAQAQVPGRMQVLDLPEQAPTVVVDFAHTPQAVTATLEALQDFERVVTVVGCGGDRDAAKRPHMGRAAAERSDLVIITDDNPRTEDPAAIRAAVAAGSQGFRAEVIDIADRGRAIAFALANSGRDNVVAILGKGHEQGQQIGDRVVAFDDAVVATAAWQAMEGSGR